jgi:RNA polymerase sigma factor (sigma-70 family)
MEELRASVQKAAEGDLRAFERLVLHFQDMAVGYGFSLLGDFHLAEDAAQEAFVEAKRDLKQLRKWMAFPSWLRRIVFKQCDRLTRSRRATLPLEEVPEPISSLPDPLASLERSEMAQMVQSAIQELPPHQREATALFYISAYSQKDVAAFLDVPLTTVQKRLHDARKRLKKRMLVMIKDNIRERRPSRDGRFTALVMQMVEAINRGDTGQVEKLVAEDKDLLKATTPLELFWHGEFQPIHLAAGRGQVEVASRLLDAGADIDAAGGNDWTPLRLALNHGHKKMVDFLVERGADVDIFSAAHRGDAQRVQDLLMKNSALADESGPEGETPLRWASTVEVARLLVDAGADMKGVLGNADEKGYLQSPVEKGYDEVVRFLIDRGYTVDISLAVRIDDAERVGSLLKDDPSLANAPIGNRKLLHLARSLEVAGLLLDAGANLHERDIGHQLMPVEWAINHDRDPELIRFLISRGAHPTIHLAGQLGDLAMAEELLDLDPTLVNWVPQYPHLLAGYAPLHTATWGGNVDVIRLLVERGADLQTRSALLDLTALGWAKRNGNEEAIRTLEELGAEE